MAASSELPSVSSTSSLPSLASRPSSCSIIADLDNQLGETTQQLQAQATPQIAKIIIPSNSNSTTTTNRPTKQMTPFRSFNSLVSKGPFQKAQFHVITALSVLYVASSATVATAQHHRKLEDEANNNDGGEEWNGEWNGEWTANDDASYECNDPNGCDSSSSSSSSNSAESNSMWLDNGDMLGPEQIITFVSLGILAFMTLLCCVCYPEILTIGCQKLCSCCMGGGGNNKDKSAVVDEELEGGGDYVRQDTEGSGKKKKKKRTSSRSRSASRSRRKNVELV